MLQYNTHQDSHIPQAPSFKGSEVRATGGASEASPTGASEASPILLWMREGVGAPDILLWMREE